MGTILITAVSVCLGFCLKSKCTSCKFCGCEIIRDVELEAAIEENINHTIDNINQLPPLTPSMLPNINNLISNKDGNIRRGSIKNSRTLQQIIDIVKPNEPINNIVDPL